MIEYSIKRNSEFLFARSVTKQSDDYSNDWFLNFVKIEWCRMRNLSL